MMVAKFWGQTYKVRIRWWWHAEVDQLHYLQCTYNPLIRTCVIECWWPWWWYEDGGDYDDSGDDVQVPCQLCDGIAGTITAHLTPRKRPHRFVPLMVVFVVMIMFWDLLWSSPCTSTCMIGVGTPEARHLKVTGAPSFPDVSNHH